MQHLREVGIVSSSEDVPEITPEEVAAFLPPKQECPKPHSPEDSPCSCGWITWEDRSPEEKAPVISFMRKLHPKGLGSRHVPYVRLQGMQEPVPTRVLLRMMGVSDR
jgi:hypothetical protein